MIENFSGFKFGCYSEAVLPVSQGFPNQGLYGRAMCAEPEILAQNGTSAGCVICLTNGIVIDLKLLKLLVVKTFSLSEYTVGMGKQSRDDFIVSPIHNATLPAFSV